MKKTLYILIVALIVIVVLGGIWMITQYIHPASSGTQTPYTNPYAYTDNTTTTVTSTSSVSGASQATMQIMLPNGKSLVVKDFIHNHETVPDTVNPDYYYLAGSIGYCLGDGTCPSGYKTNDFSVTYHATDGHFNIILLTEPLATARTEVEVFLLDRLGVNEAQLCNINYWIGTSGQTSAVYTNKNLGFDFCPGATQL
jgi:hypothetical protein